MASSATVSSTLSPAPRRTARRVVVALVVVPLTLFGLSMLAVVGADIPAMLTTLAGLTLIGSGLLSWIGRDAIRRSARETLSAVCALLSGVGAFAGSMFVGIATGAVGFMEPGTADDEWMVLSVVVAVATVPLVWWLVRREVVTR
jgi:hypothetical protein